MNNFLNGLKDTANLTYTENGARSYRSTKSDLLDLFALGGAYRARSEQDCIFLFMKAYEENSTYAMKCLFYLADVREGQGERRFFKTCYRWLANKHTDIARRNMKLIPYYTRWDNLYCLVDTPLETEMFKFMKEQLALDVQSKTPSLLAKWLKSENASSKATKALAIKTRKAFGMTSKQYRKTLSILRERINVLERLMSKNRWDEIEYDKIPSKAGFIYRNAFARHDIERIKAGKETYADFAKDETKTVNADTLYPYEVVAKALDLMFQDYGWYRPNTNSVPLDDTQRLMINKYWANLANYFEEAEFNGMAIVDTSGSMCGNSASAPINVALSLGLYCAEKAKGPFANCFMTFSNKPEFIEVEGIDFCDKVARMTWADWGMNTNIEAAFDLMLQTAINNHCSQDEIPKNLIIISDMEFDACCYSQGYNSFSSRGVPDETLFETLRNRWESAGYQMPKLTFWNVNARHDLIPMKDDGNVRYISGMSPVIFEQVMKDLSAYDLMMDKLNSERYKDVE